MYRMTKEEVEKLKEELSIISSYVDDYEEEVNLARKGQNKFLTVDDIHDVEEQLHYMRGYLKLLKIRAYKQGLKVD